MAHAPDRERTTTKLPQFFWISTRPTGLSGRLEQAAATYPSKGASTGRPKAWWSASPLP